MDVNFYVAYEYYEDGCEVLFTTPLNEHQQVQVGFAGFEVPHKRPRRIHWFMSLVVFNKRNKINEHFDRCEITGSSGAESFVIAREAMKIFEEKELTSGEFANCEHVLFIGGVDSLRRKIYGHFLKRYGFKAGRDPDGHWAMIKNIKHKTYKK